jgi:hypothetical protein
MPGGSKKGGGLTTKKSTYGAPYKMKGSPYKHTSASHPTGAIAAHKGHGSMTKTFRNIKPKVKRDIVPK